MLTKAPKGTKDIIPSEVYKWQYVEKVFKDVCASFGFEEVRTPVFEHTELFERGAGDTSDVVEKQMYTFNDKGGRSITLRPEGTSSAVRAFLENNLYAGTLPVKMFYEMSCFRYERPQAGRMRQFHQFGIEMFGAGGASADAEIISLAITFLSKLGLKGLDLNINSIGCPECRNEYNKKLKEYFSQYSDKLCPTCLSRLERNPLRILDCKSPECQEIGKDAPVILDHLCDDCKESFEKTKTMLSAMGIKYEIDTGIVRGLDYYNGIVFEIIAGDIGAKSTVCGGGRYDGLVSQLGGQPTPGIGFGLGIERLLLAMELAGIEIPKPKGIDIFIGTIGEEAKLKAQKLAYELRQKGIKADIDHLDRSVKAQMKYADKIGAEYTVVIGDTEIENNKANLKNMLDGTVKEIEIDKIGEEFI